MIDSDRFEYMRQQLQKRVKPSRYAHSLGVSQTAEQLARIYGVNENDAAVAGLLHDWDKALSTKELRHIAKKHTNLPKSVRKNIPGVLHAYTAAYSLRKKFPDLSDEVLQAVEHHTCAASDMSDLDMVVFIADIIEPGRTFKDVDPLRDAVGKVSLEELFYMTFKSTLIYLLEDDMPVFPDSLRTWNTWVKRREKSKDGCFGSAPGNEVSVEASSATSETDEREGTDSSAVQPSSSELTKMDEAHGSDAAVSEMEPSCEPSSPSESVAPSKGVRVIHIE